MTIARVLTALTCLLLVPMEAKGRETPFAEISSVAELHAIFSAGGYVVEEENSRLFRLHAPDGTRVTAQPAETAGSCCDGVRLQVFWLVGDSRAAVETALYYEQTNPLAAVRIVDSEDGFIIVVTRDVLFASQRTPQNLVANVDLLVRLTPVFQSALVRADPGLPDYWASLQGDTP